MKLEHALKASRSLNVLDGTDHPGLARTVYKNYTYTAHLTRFGVIAIARGGWYLANPSNELLELDCWEPLNEA